METLGLAPAGKLYSPVQIGVAALLGSPAAAGWFISQNETHLGRPHNGRRWFWGCVIGSLILLGVGFFLPPGFPNSALAIGYTAGFYTVAKQLYGVIVASHRAAGGVLGSWWTVVGLALLFTIVIMVAIFTLVFLLPDHVIG